MKKISYTVQDALGLHARPAGLLAKLAKEYPDASITVTKNGKTVKATQLIMLMGMCVKCGDTIEVAAEGPAEEKAICAVQDFLCSHL